MRPKTLANDKAADYPVIIHALKSIQNNENYDPDIIVYLRPTMPTRTSVEIDNVVKMLISDEKAGSIRTTRPAPYPPFWMKKLNKSGYLVPYDENVAPYEKVRRQDLPKVVICDGYVDAAKVAQVLKNDNFPTGKVLSYYRENSPYFDIDTEEDWNKCEQFIMNGN